MKYGIKTVAILAQMYPRARSIGYVYGTNILNNVYSTLFSGARTIHMHIRALLGGFCTIRFLFIDILILNINSLAGKWKWKDAYGANHFTSSITRENNTVDKSSTVENWIHFDTFMEKSSGKKSKPVFHYIEIFRSQKCQPEIDTVVIQS